MRRTPHTHADASQRSHAGDDSYLAPQPTAPRLVLGERSSAGKARFCQFEASLEGFGGRWHGGRCDEDARMMMLRWRMVVVGCRIGDRVTRQERNHVRW